MTCLDIDKFQTRKICLYLARPVADEALAAVSLMLNRMGMSYMKYGRVADAYPAKVDAIASLELRLRTFEQTSNTEFLLDAANFAMIEHRWPRHPQPVRIARFDFDAPHPRYVEATLPGTEFGHVFLQEALVTKTALTGVAGARHALARYAVSGDEQDLFDAGATLLSEYRAPMSADAFFAPTDADQSPGRVTVGGLVNAKANTESWGQTPVPGARTA